MCFIPSIHSYKYTYVTFIFSFIQPVVGILAKFPKWHLFLSKTYFSIGKLWAIIKILISAQLSFKSTLITYLVLTLAIKVMAFWEISPLALLYAVKLCLMYGQMGNF